jgi:hypothetical protein
MLSYADEVIKQGMGFGMPLSEQYIWVALFLFLLNPKLPGLRAAAYS